MAAKSDSVRKSKIEKDIEKVDVKNLELRSSKPTRNSQREVSLTKSRRSARLSSRRKLQSSNRRRSTNMMDTDHDEEVFSASTYSARN